MNLPIKVLTDVKDLKLNIQNRITTLNPNAAEFIPSALRSTVGETNGSKATKLDMQGDSGKAVLDRSESHVSNNSDDEVHQYWRHQLPDDITFDFKFMVEEESQGSGHLSLAGLSIHDGIETSRLTESAGVQTLGTQRDISHIDDNHYGWGNELGRSSSTYHGDQSSAAFMTPCTNYGEREFTNIDRYLTDENEGHNGDPTTGFLNDLLGDHAVTEDAPINPVEFLESQFPGFSADSLADVYYANGCDLNFTIEILTQLELQVDHAFSQNVNSKALAAPNFNNVLDFPALPVSDAQKGLSKYLGEDFQPSLNRYRTPGSIYRDGTDYASTVRKLASQDSASWNYERNGSDSVGVSRNSQLLASPHEKLVSGDKLRTYGAARAAAAWLETGDSVANMYSETREEARDYARLRNTCFEQARHAYLIGNKALAKDLSVKGQLYNMKMKEAHGKARDTIYRQRNPAGAELQGQGRSPQECLIDLHGLHVSEAIHVLKHELGILRSTARSAGKRLQVMICVGTGHHTKGSRTPARLPVAVEQYLLGEGLHYTQPQPGLLRAVIY